MGNDGGILVNHGGLDEAAQMLAQGVKAIENRMDQLESELSPLRGDWSGMAKGAYDQAKARWDQAISEMQIILAATSRTVRQSNQEYADADRRGAASFDIG